MILQKIEIATTKTGNTYRKLTLDGKTYNFFGELQDIAIGDTVLCEFETSGKFTNLKSIEKVAQQSFGVNATQAVSEAIKGIIVSRTENANSYEFGKAGNRFKLYFETVEDLLRKMQELKEAGLHDEEVLNAE